MIKYFCGSVKPLFTARYLQSRRNHLSNPPLTMPISYWFSDKKDKLPRNKQEAWMMQQQKNLKPLQDQEEDEGKNYKGINKYGIMGLVLLTGSLIYMINLAGKQTQKQLDIFEEDISGLKQKKQRQQMIGGDWTLIDADGRAFSSSMLSGYYYLLYFGFTNCPDICPSTLYYLSSVYRIIRNIPEGAYMKLKIVFISVDPQRDTPNIMKEYVANFSKNIIGVTASGLDDPDLKQCMKKFRIHSHRIEAGEGKRNKYNIDHTTRVYLMDPQNVYLYHLDPSLTEPQAAKAIVAKIIENQHKKQKQQERARS